MSKLAIGCLAYFDFSQFPNATNIARLLGRSAGDITFGSGLVSKPNLLKRRVMVTAKGSTNYRSTFTSPLASNAFASAHSIYCRYSVNDNSKSYIAGIINDYQLLHNFVDGQVEFLSFSYTGANPRTTSGMAFAYDGKEHSACYTYDGATQRGYVDGLKLVENTKTYALTGGNTGVVINGSGTTNDMFAGTVQCFGMWNRPLTQAEIKEIDRDPSWWKPAARVPTPWMFVSSASFKAWLYYMQGLRND